MDLKIYKKTRYQNIYKHKNGNYIISISKPVKTSISRIDGKKIISIDDAIRIRDNYLKKAGNTNLNSFLGNLDSLWDKYIFDCKYVRKLAYNTILRKEKAYNKYLKNKVNLNLHKTTKSFWIKFVADIDTTDMQKNEIIKQLKGVFNWAVENELLSCNPLDKVKKYKIEKKEMDVWTKNDLLNFIKCINTGLKTSCIQKKNMLYILKLVSYIGFCYGLRVGEIRALKFNSFKEQDLTMVINHSINYDRNGEFLSKTKTNKSNRILAINKQIIDIINEYKKFLEKELKVKINKDNIIIFNYSSMAPYSDTVIRRHFDNYIVKANVKRIHIKDLRHSYATNMLANDVSIKYVSENMGHSSIKITGDVYSHIIDDKRREIAKITDDLFF